jgi:gluconokinase
VNCADGFGPILYKKIMAPVPITILIVMGVAGCGKSTAAALIAARLGWPMVEGDDLHPPENIAKMARGLALDDADRQPWLAAIEARLDAWRAARCSGVATCSALKRAYRDRLARGRPEVRFVYLRGDKKLIAERVAVRRGHFMAPSLLASQFAALEEPSADEPVVSVEIGPPPTQMVDAILAIAGLGRSKA